MDKARKEMLAEASSNYTESIILVCARITDSIGV